MNKRLFLFLVLFSVACSKRTPNEMYEVKRTNIIEVCDKIHEIVIEEVLISRLSKATLLDDYLIIGDYKSIDNQLHIFYKNNFKYIMSLIPIGQGPGEIANMGYIAANNNEHFFYVTDYGKNKIFGYCIDSVLLNPFYLPEKEFIIAEKQIPMDYQYISDTLCIGYIMEPTGNSGFNQHMAKWSIKTGSVKLMNYTHPKIKNKRASSAVSNDKRIYVECFHYQDLMTICDFEGNLKHNIYGKKNWNTYNNRTRYYGDVAFCDDKIVALYSSGENAFYKDRNGKTRTNKPTKFLIFDINGKYLKTLETGYQIVNFCYDKDYERIIMCLDDEIQFAYLDLKGLV